MAATASTPISTSDSLFGDDPIAEPSSKDTSKLAGLFNHDWDSDDDGEFCVAIVVLALHLLTYHI
jgi:hypothetical protein